MGLIKTSGGFNRERPTITETYITNASTVIAEARAFIGGVQMVGGVLAFVPPAIHSSGLICLSADFDVDFQGDGNLATSNVAYLTVQYGIPETDQQEQQDIELGSASFSLGGSMLQLERDSYQWAEGSKEGEILKADEDVKPFIIVAETTATVKTNFKRTIDIDYLSANFYGRVNSTTLSLPGLTTPIRAGFARFDGCEAEKKFSTDGFQFYVCSYKFAIASHDWNKCWDGEQYSALDKLIYPTANLNGVFAV